MPSPNETPIFIRPFTEDEQRKVQAELRSSDTFILRRCQILLASARGERVPKIALQLGCDDQTVRNVIQGFNTDGLSVLEEGSSRPHRLRTTFKQEGKGVRILPLFLPKQSPWLNLIEPKWVHAKRNVVEPNGLLTALQLAQRICTYFGCSYQFAP